MHHAVGAGEETSQRHRLCVDGAVSVPSGHEELSRRRVAGARAARRRELPFRDGLAFVGRRLRHNAARPEVDRHHQQQRRPHLVHGHERRAQHVFLTPLPRLLVEQAATHGLDGGGSCWLGAERGAAQQRDRQAEPIAKSANHDLKTRDLAIAFPAIRGTGPGVDAPSCPRRRRDDWRALSPILRPARTSLRHRGATQGAWSAPASAPAALRSRQNDFACEVISETQKRLLGPL